MSNYDYLIVGAGFTGAVLAERLASQFNSRVLLIDRRSHVGGNAYDLRSADGVLYHLYGPHIFHTNSHKIFSYLSNFTKWTEYKHKVLGLVHSRLVPIPFNLTSLEILFSNFDARRLSSLLVETYGTGALVPILDLKKSDNHHIKALSEYIYENVFLGYTRKQWDMEPEELLPSVTARVPVSISHESSYFQDKYQFIPSQGYSHLFKNILNNNNIDISLNTEFSQLKKDLKAKNIIYTGQIDEYFDFIFGSLPYRTVDFDFRTYSQRQH